MFVEQVKLLRRVDHPGIAEFENFYHTAIDFFKDKVDYTPKSEIS